VSEYDWSAAAAAAIHLGARPVFADIDPERYTLHPHFVARAISERTRAIVVTHVFGQPADSKVLLGLARARGISLIEDCAQAFGASIDQIPVGSFGDAACFSFGSGKLLDAGGGGIVVMENRELFEEAALFSQHPDRHRREGLCPNPFSVNFRIDPLTAALALGRLHDWRSRLEGRRQIADQLTSMIGEAPGVRAPAVAREAVHSFSRYSPTIDCEAWRGTSRSRIIQALAAEGVPVGEDPVGVPLSRVVARSQASEDQENASARCDEIGIEMGYLDALDPPELWFRQMSRAIAKVYDARASLTASG
jgi:dTDP-4-amino-4,6-dideoxygalactose transaminase